MLPVVVACGVAGAGAGVGTGSGAGAGTAEEENGDPCGVTPPGEEAPGEASIGM